MQRDYVIVGSGLSALAFGALMAAAGKRVLLLEAHYVPGGYGHTFVQGKPPDEYRFNAQLHYVWNCGPDDTVGLFLRKLGLHEHVGFERLDPMGFDRMRMPGYALDIPNDWELLADRLAALFPADADRCRDFLTEVCGVADEIDHLPKAPRTLRMLPQLYRYRRMIRHRKATLQDGPQALHEGEVLGIEVDPLQVGDAHGHDVAGAQLPCDPGGWGAE